LLCRNLDRSRSRHTVRVLIGLPVLLASWSAGAVNWEVAPRVLGGYRYSDNYRLEPTGSEIDVSGAEADAQVTLRNVDPRTRFEVTPRIRSTYFPDEREEDSTDYFLGTKLFDETPRRRMGIDAAFSREDVVRTELPSAGDVGGDLGDPQTGDAGRTLQRNRRDLIRVAPSFAYDFTERYRMELEARYVDAAFDKQFANAQQDFTDAGVSAGFGYRYSQRSSLLFRALTSRYKTNFDTDAYGGDVEWSTDFSPTSRMYVRLGAQNTKPESGSGDTSIISGIGGRWASQRNVLFLDLTRSVGPIAAGTIVERHQLRLRIDHDVSPRVALLFGARASRDEEIDGGGTYPTRDYATAEAGVEWRVQRFLSITASYNYRWQEYEDEPSDRSANGFLIGIVYEPKRPD
jgi:hypothetical protein